MLVLTAVKFIGSIGFQEIELVFVCNPKKNKKRRKKGQIGYSQLSDNISFGVTERTCSLLRRQIKTSLKRQKIWAAYE
jgi:hypothetical protein